MNMPGFSAQSSLYKTRNHYAAGCGIASNGSVVPQQLSAALSNSQLYVCRLACAYCSYVGWYCWTCFICAWFVELGWLNEG